MKREIIEEAITNIDDKFVAETAQYRAEQGASGLREDASAASGAAAESPAASGSKQAQAGRTPKKGLLHFFKKHYALTTVAAMLVLAVGVFAISRVSSDSVSSDRSGYAALDGDSYLAGGAIENESYFSYGMTGHKEAMAEPGEAPTEAINEYTGSSLVREDTKIIYNASITAETLEFRQAAQMISDLVSENGGYFEDSEEYDSGSGYMTASYRIRIPAENFTKVTEGVQELCNVTRNHISKTDVTDTYNDIESRLETVQIRLDRLQELLKQAENMEDIITLEEAISDAQWEADSYASQLKGYDLKVAYSTIDITLKEVYKQTEVTAPRTFWEKLGDSFSEGLESFAEFWGDFALWFVYNWTFLLFVAAIAVVIILLIRRRRRKKRPET
ncbi:MAG: DUF4349 domain-containing protein [Lachnospiraceae bacterium]|nr:DUF4349 domain-containing protein [Lachnospiraceae bacterium]